MPQLPFIKMHGAENDYIFFDGLSGPLPEDPAQLAPRLCDRHAGVGADGIICMVAPADALCDVQMQIWNADGSSAEMCGNAARCIAVWMQQQGRIQDRCRIQVCGRVVTAEHIQSHSAGGSATVNVGRPQLITTAVGRVVPVGDETSVTVHQVRIGNPHAVLFPEFPGDELVAALGPYLEHHTDPEERTNVEFVSVTGPSELTVRVWERGSGETRACGSGACAAVAAATQVGLLEAGEHCRVHLPGGTLDVQWRDGDDILLSGPAVIAFTGHLTAEAAPG